METEMLTPNQVAKLTGASLREIQWWDERGYVRPRIRGHCRRWAPHDVRTARIIKELRNRGVPLQQIGDAIDGDFRKLVEKIPEGETGWLLWMHEDDRRVAWFSTASAATTFAARLHGPVTVVELSAA